MARVLILLCLIAATASCGRIGGAFGNLGLGIGGGGAKRTQVEVKGNEEIEYDGEVHTAANLYDALKEGYYGKF